MKKTLLAVFLGAWCAAAVAEALPPAAAVPYLTGGVGDEELAALRERAGDFNLRLLFADKSTGQYLAAVKVRIENAQGQPVLETESTGPLFYAKLTAGRYRLTVEADGVQQKRQVTIKAGRPVQAVFYWVGHDSPM